MRWLNLLSLCLVAETALAKPGEKHNYKRAYNPFVQTIKRDGTAPNYDYIVVGSGPGGGPVAANLAIAGFKVLLIDAGGDSGNATQEVVPLLHLASSEFVDTAWTFYTHHYNDSTTQARDSKMVYTLQDGTQYIGKNPPAGATPLGIDYPRAGTLGGCSRHNAIITMLAHDSDWSNIASMTGDSSWAPSNMTKYWQTVESNRYLPSSVVGHGYTGWLTTSVTSLTLVLQDSKFLALVASAITASGGKGLLGTLLSTVTSVVSALVLDLNAPGQNSIEGLYQVPLAMKDGVRSSPRDFILNTATATNADGSRKYFLDIKLNTLVSKVVFDQSGARPRAVGVQYLEGQDLYRAHSRSGAATVTGTGAVNATREVIVAGGVFNTPQLLKLSGVGPAAELNSFNIPVVVNLPGVGTNMQDRYENSIVSTSAQDYDLVKSCTFGAPGDPCLATWNSGTDQLSRGVYATNGVAIAKILKTSVSTGEPDMAILGAPVGFTGYYPGYSVAGYSNKRRWSWLILKAHSRNSAGTVKLISTDPRDTPNITFNSFAMGGDQDVQAITEGVKWARSAMAAYIPASGAFNETWPIPGTASTDANLRQWIRDEAWGHHASCTCPIGADGDPMAVLDSRFRVRGVDGLRVVDASAFPKIPGFFIAAPLYIMSQKASETIIADAAQSS